MAKIHVLVYIVKMQLNALQYRRMYFDEFCAAAICVQQLEVLDNWEERTRSAYQIFEKHGNRAIVIEELASVSLIIIIIIFYFLSFSESCVISEYL